jgi:S-DNA-T family DNA segregation ATPase FtsK/SpoIIIE
MHLTFKLLNGEVIEQSVRETFITIGRSPKCTVVIPNEGISRQHCQLEIVDGEVFVTDLGSTNGVLIDGERIEAHKKIAYQTFLTLSFGPVQSLQIELEENKSSLQVNSLSQNGKIAGPEQNNTYLTRTKILREDKTTPDTKTLKSPLKKDGPKGVQFWLVNIIALLLVLGAAYWYAMGESDAPTYGDELPDVEISTE